MGGFEQSRINYYIRNTKSHSRVLVYPARAFNAKVGQYKFGDFIVHLYNVPNKDLYLKFKEYEKKYGYILDKEKKQ